MWSLDWSLITIIHRGVNRKRLALKIVECRQQPTGQFLYSFKMDTFLNSLFQGNLGVRVDLDISVKLTLTFW